MFLVKLSPGDALVPLFRVERRGYGFFSVDTLFLS